MTLSNPKHRGLVDISLELFGTPVSNHASSHLLRSNITNTSMVRSLPVHFISFLQVYYLPLIFFQWCFPLFPPFGCRFFVMKTSVMLRKCTRNVSRKAPFPLMIAFPQNAWKTALRLEKAHSARCFPWWTMPVRLWLLKCVSKTLYIIGFCKQLKFCLSEIFGSHFYQVWCKWICS